VAATSQDYTFGENFNVDQLILESFERIGKLIDRSADDIVTQDVNAAVRCANLQLSHWASTEDLLFLIQREMFPLVDGQAFYQLPGYVARVLKNEVVRSNYVRRNTSGNAIVSDGSPTGAPCFDDASSVGCTQTTPNGWIGYAYTIPPGVAQQIWYVGILSLTQTNYTLAIEYSQDGVNWILAKQLPTLIFSPLIPQWFVLEQPPAAQYWRIREIRGSTLAIQQIYFANPDGSNPDIALGNLDRSSFLQLSLKLNPTSIPSAYYFNEKKVKSLYLYGNNYANSNAIVYDAAVYAQTIERLYQLPDSAIKYLDPLAAGMAYRLAFKYNLPLDRVNMLKNEYNETFGRVRSADKEDVDVTMSINMGSVWDVA
jgi:hypothetical protein